MVNIREIKLLALDVDGVLTDGRITYTDEGEELKSFYAKDGLGIVAALTADLKVAVITGRHSDMVQRRVQELGIPYLYENCRAKLTALQKICAEEQISLAETAYMGDDINDLAVLRNVGLAMAPSDACQDVKQIAQFISKYKGGEGAVRDGIEHILKEQSRWEAIIEAYGEERQHKGQ